MDLAKRLFFLGGIHGVGKGTFCQDLMAAVPLACVTASDLIRNYRPSDDGHKRVEHIGANQSALLDALAVFRASEDRDLVLDGHYALFDGDGRVQDIADEVFLALNPDRLMLMTDDVASIQVRLQGRDGHSPSVAMLQVMAARELRKADSLSKTLGIPLKVFLPGVPVEDILVFLGVEGGAAA